MGIVIESQTFIGVASDAAGSRAQVWLPAGFTLTGGGAYDMGSGERGNLTACCPLRNEEGRYTGWMASGTGAGAEAPMAVYAVGIRIVKDGAPVPIEQQVFCATSALVADPGVTVRLGAGWIGTGGGAQDNHASALNGHSSTSERPLLGADGQILGWSASARAHDGLGHARVSAYVVGIKTRPDVAIDAATLSACLRPAFPATPIDLAAAIQGPVSVGGRLAGYGKPYAERRGAMSCAILSASAARETAALRDSAAVFEAA